MVPIVISPLIKIEMLQKTASIEQYSGLIFTSENGVRAFQHNWQNTDLPAWCVGDRTAKAASRAGLSARSAKGDAGNLVDMIISDAPTGCLLHLRGEHTRGAVASSLQAAGVKAEERIVYRQSPQCLTKEAKEVLQGDMPVILPLFSPRSAVLFVEQARPCSESLRVVAISAAVKDALSGCISGEILVSPQPDADGVLSTMARLMDA